MKVIQRTGGVILGCRPLHRDGITGLREVTHRGGGTVYLYEGATRLRPATRDATWGLDVIRIRAEHHFVAE